MKNSTKLFATAVAAVALFFVTNVNAQMKKGGSTGANLEIGLNAGFPTNYTDFYNFVGGADLRAQFNVSKQVSIIASAGYTNFFGKTVSGFNYPDYGYIPVKIGPKWSFEEKGKGAYASAELGAAFGVTNGSGTSFLYSPSIGYDWSNGLDLSVKYEGLAKSGANYGQVALRVAYGFKL